MSPSTKSMPESSAGSPTLKLTALSNGAPVFSCEQAVEKEWSRLTMLFIISPELRNTNVIRPFANLPDNLLSESYSDNLIDGFIKEATFCFAGWINSMYMDFGDKIGEMSFAQAVCTYLREKCEYPTITWLHKMCASQIKGLDSTTYHKHASIAPLIKDVAEFCITAIPEDISDLWIEVGSLYESRFAKLLAKWIRVDSLSRIQKRNKKGDFRTIWINGIVSFFVALGLFEAATDSPYYFYTSRFDYIRPTALLRDIMKGTVTTKGTAADIGPYIFLDTDMPVARFTDSHSRALLLDAGGTLISDNRVVFSPIEMMRNKSPRPLNVHKDRLQHLAKLEVLPPLWQKLFDDAARLADSVSTTNRYQVLICPSAHDYERLTDVLENGESWTRHIIRTEANVILIERDRLSFISHKFKEKGIHIIY